MKGLNLLLVTVLSTVSCTGQTWEKIEESNAKPKWEKISPSGDYSVNKEYDEEGNLIKLDSTYTYSYSSKLDGPMTDSLRIEIQKRFGEFGFSINHDFFGDSFFESSSPNEIMDQMHQRMDSIQKRFFDESFIVPKQKNWIEKEE
ncbi:MAG: hypothetical protein H6584_04095 [Flavobacteriales bacterium]|nr:hypothetical protein [Flavobacteriales bacterium]